MDAREQAGQAQAPLAAGNRSHRFFLGFYRFPALAPAGKLVGVPADIFGKLGEGPGRFQVFDGLGI